MGKTLRVLIVEDAEDDALLLAPCSEEDSRQLFDFSVHDRIEFAGACLAIASTEPEVGAQLVLDNECFPQASTEFHVSGRIMNSGRCLAITDDNSFNGATLELRDCSSAASVLSELLPDPLLWEYYW